MLILTVGKEEPHMSGFAEINGINGINGGQQGERVHQPVTGGTLIQPGRREPGWPMTLECLLLRREVFMFVYLLYSCEGLCCWERCSKAK